MDVKCENCGTEYEFDDSKVTAAGITVKCTHCGHLFRVSRDAPQPAAPSTASRTRHWMIRNRHGEIREFRDLSTLQQWIVARKVSRDDEISKTGETWKRLGSIVELAGVFNAVESTGSVGDLFGSGSASIELSSVPPDAAPPPFGPAEVIPTGKFRLEGPRKLPAPPPPASPAASIDDAPTIRVTRDHRVAAVEAVRSVPPAPLAFSEPPPPGYTPPAQSSGRGFWLGMLTAVALAGVGYFVYDTFMRPDAAAPTAAGSVSERAVRRGETAYQRDTEADFARAEAEFTKALRQLGEPPSDPRLAVRALLGRARVAIARAEYTKLAQQDASAHLRIAGLALEDARLLAPDDAGLRLVQADLHRVGGDNRRANAALEGLQVPDALHDELRLVQAALPIHAGNWVAARDQLKGLPAGALEQPRARLLYATALARSGRTQDAIFELERVLTRQPDHDAANRLYTALRPRSPATISAAAVSRSPVGQAAPRTIMAGTAPSSTASPSAPKPAPERAASKSAAKKAQNARQNVAAKAPKKAPRSFDGLMTAARRAQENGRTNQARRLLLQAIRIKPNQPEALSSLGWCDVDDGKFRRAINYFQRALGRSDGYSEARYGLGVALERSGQKSAAKKIYQEYLTKHPRGRRRRIVERKVKIL